jgi:hypothetical protein
MSIDCVGCNQMVCQPDIPWYAGTSFSPLLNYLCGTCVAVLPKASRRPVSAMRDFEITFGPVFADICSHRKYQGYDSRNGRPLFAVSAKTIFENIPYSEWFLEELYPYWCMDWFCEDLLECEDYKKAALHLWYRREPVKVWLELPNKPRTNIERFDEFRIYRGTFLKKMNITDKELSPDEKKEMENLMVRVCEWVGKD